MGLDDCSRWRVANVTALFWDVGGVLLTNGWDRGSRRRAAQKFALDWDEFEDRHELVVNAFETGKAALQEYLQRTVFYRPRAFSPADFQAFMFSESQPLGETIALLGRLATGGRYLVATVNNESLELNEYRIRHYELRKYFSAFFSSCYLGVRKPDAAIYKLALSITQRAPAECVMIDDRPLNLECAKELGISTIAFTNTKQLEEDLARRGVAPALG
jgi:putative hydrolase of the HAD superfamily